MQSDHLYAEHLESALDDIYAYAKPVSTAPSQKFQQMESMFRLIPVMVGLIFGTVFLFFAYKLTSPLYMPRLRAK